MRRSRVRRRSVALFALPLALGAALLACSAPTADPAPPPPKVAPEVLPYVDVSLRPSPLPDMVAQTGVRSAVLAFVLSADGSCTPSWGGETPITDPVVVEAARSLEQVTVATGGATGTYLENTCTDAGALAGAYRAALASVGATRLDVDVETGIDAEKVAGALGLLQGIDVTLTLPVHDAAQGLTPAALDLARTVAAHGVDARVNAMVMNFPDEGDWSGAMLRATDTIVGQLGRDPSRTGVTLMLGRNDTGPVTTLADAARVVGVARDRGIGAVGLWSVGRDNGDCPGTATASYACSGIPQTRFAFIRTTRDVSAGLAPPEDVTP
ncbi:carbohydrate-binding protein CenC [Pseudonocardia kujensis]|uniref:carbohydrate-binding protein CenC n=1 Tax=Pseudonocardia kujensis TaxID=1128675 RepID=UPI001E41ABEC|nr:carbohydrate-binding protein CenC [Pseudonocardia kujensis]MCE0761346.1 carbohydrate-binding protein CenC [Pseudonocardia kujensis]